MVKPGMYARGKDQIKESILKVTRPFDGQLKVRQGKMEVIEGG